jgi:hypothetical protein
LASYSAIVEAIDAAILAWCGQAVELSVGGRTTRYRSLDELTRARKYYASLAANSAAGGRKFRVSEIKSNGMR